MDKRTAAQRLDEEGVTSVQFLLASALGLLLFLTVANIVVVQYGRGALRSALEQGARVGTVSGATACEATAGAVVEQLIGGAMSDGLEVVCVDEGATIRAGGSAVFTSWTPLTPDYPVEMSVTAIVEP